MIKDCIKKQITSKCYACEERFKCWTTRPTSSGVVIDEVILVGEGREILKKSLGPMVLSDGDTISFSFKLSCENDELK